MLLLLAAGGLLASCGGGTSQDEVPTTGNYAPIKPAPILKNNENGIDPGLLSRSGTDVLTVLRSLGPSGGTSAGIERYELLVTNTSSIGYINSFSWDPPPGTTIVEITKNSKGTCDLSGGRIHCNATLHPPSCTCKGDGGSMTIDFSAKVPPDTPGTSHGSVGASLNVETQTPVPYFIPSSPLEKPGRNSDLPFCAAGEESTASNPCVPKG